MISPLIDELAAEYAGKFTMVKINTDEAPQTASNFGVRSIPTIIVSWVLYRIRVWSGVCNGCDAAKEQGTIEVEEVGSSTVWFQWAGVQEVAS